MAETAASILLVDDHAVIAEPIRMALEASGFGPVSTVDPSDLGLETVIAVAEARRPDIVLLDLHLGGDRTALPMVTPLVATGAAVVLFTASSDPLLLAPALRSGATAVIDKSIPFDRLVAALRDLAATGRLMPDDERAALLEALGAHEAEAQERRRPFEALTQREAEVLRALIEGRSPKEVAHSGGSSVSTVRGHIQAVLTKLRVSSQREALAMARAAGWPPDGA